MRVLIADDEYVEIQLLTAAVMAACPTARVTPANSVDAALDALRLSPAFDVVVTDLHFGPYSLDGREIVTHALARSQRSVVILTSSDAIPAEMLGQFIADAVGPHRRVFFTGKRLPTSDLGLVVELVLRRSAVGGDGSIYVSFPHRSARYEPEALRDWVAQCASTALRPPDSTGGPLQPPARVVLTRLSMPADAFGHIHDSIRRCSLLVADLDQQRPNIYAEIGAAQALDKPVLLLAPEGDAPPAFNVLMLPTAPYGRTPVADPACTAALTEFIRQRSAAFGA